MAATINSFVLSCRSPRSIPTNIFCVAYPTCTKAFNRASAVSRAVFVKCGSEESENGGFKEALSGMVGKQVEELLNREENRVLLEGLEKASQRVEKARRELAEIEKQEIEAKQLRNYIEQLEGRSSEIAECQREILEARAKVEEAERSLSINMGEDGDRDGFLETESEEINKEKERLESVKAALVSAMVGTFAGLPIFLTQVTSSSQLLLPLAINFVSCALFGITFRYTIRRDLDNIQLKTGTSAAFGFVKGLATLGGGSPLELNTGSFLSHAFDGVLCLIKGTIWPLGQADVETIIVVRFKLLNDFETNGGSGGEER
ncbi:hypothetical protein PVL29_001712 [Vitis rotundifolia]|uniref:Homer protein n=1 Tax=Vitis rotundifolia TaxID=103349 RepID=A0AA39AEU1_VITRO|nr:hypothetical protein PVL29_001712 [Vitis rotundifolia]